MPCHAGAHVWENLGTPILLNFTTHIQVLSLLSQALSVTLDSTYLALNSNSGGQYLNCNLYFLPNITVQNFSNGLMQLQSWTNSCANKF